MLQMDLTFSGKLIELPLSYINKVPRDGGCGGHHGADQVRAAAAALPAFEVTIAR